MKNTYAILIFTLLTVSLFGQSIGVNDDGSAPNASAMFDIKSTSKGILIPRMTSAERSAIPVPASGLLVYDTDKGVFMFYKDGQWQEIFSGDDVPDRIEDEDGDTRVRTEASPNEDVIRFDIGGVERATIDSDKLFVDGKVQINVADEENAEGNVIVRQADGTLATRDASTITPTPKLMVSATGDTLSLGDNSWVIVPGISAAQPIKDGDGNVYTSVVIGTQEWMVENLKTTSYNDCSPIELVTDDAEWTGLSTPAYCWYGNDSTTYADPYGALYNWHVVSPLTNGGKNVCPVGWHVPTDAEWDVLRDFVDPGAGPGGNVAGGHMKSTGTIQAGTGLWEDPNTGATNSSGFTGEPNGYRGTDGFFFNIGFFGSFWSSTEASSTHAWGRLLFNFNAFLGRNQYNKNLGYSIRCVKD